MVPSIHSDSVIPPTNNSLLGTSSSCNTNGFVVLVEDELRSPSTEKIVDSHEREAITKEEAAALANLNHALTKEINTVEKRRRLSSKLLSPSNEPSIEAGDVLEGLNYSNEVVVKSVKDLVDAGITHVPKFYVRPPEDRPRLSQISDTLEVPVIDMHGFLDSSQREKIIDAIGHACKEWGIFRVINHGVQDCTIENMIHGVEGFFNLPSSERALYYSNDVNKPVNYVTSFNQQREKLLNWKDSLRFRYSPTQMGNFASLPPICREAVMDYCKETSVLRGRMYEGLSESLGLRGDYLEKVMGERVAAIHVNMHYYPPCPEPELTFGLSGHSDPNLFTVLATLDNVHGLQFFKDGSWIALTPLPHSLLVNIGDQMQILTNGKYRSVEHRVITNTERARISVAAFCGPSDDTVVGPLPELVGPPNGPPLYKPTRYKDYVSNFYNNGLARKSSLDFASLFLGGPLLH